MEAGYSGIWRPEKRQYQYINLKPEQDTGEEAW